MASSVWNLLFSTNIAVPPEKRKGEDRFAVALSAATFLSANPPRWGRWQRVGLACLIALWAVLFAATWATWGSVSVDCGRELYVAAAIVQKQTLYRDVWYLYGPLAPYFNALLFHMFGLRMEVFYWAGSLSALSSAVFLYLAGMRLSSPIVGWTAGSVVLAQAFVPDIFCFPLPYSFAAVYGCFVASLLLWLGLHAMDSANVGWILGAGGAACAALLLKLEYGAPCYVFLFLLIAVRTFRHRNGKRLGFDLLAVLPGIVICTLVIWWMISLCGVEFITQENIMSWPTNYFMKTYGKLWLGFTGATMGDTKAVAIWSIVLSASFLLLLHMILRRSASLERRFFSISIVFITLVAALVGVLPAVISLRAEAVLRAFFFPGPMVLVVAFGGGVTLLLLWQRRLPQGAIRLVPVCVFSSLLAARLYLSTAPLGYSIYYDGPLVLSFLLLGKLVAPATTHRSQFHAQWELLVCFGCLITAFTIVAKHAPKSADRVPLKTARGTIRVPPAMASKYSLALNFMRERAVHGEYVLSIPEDTGLYFLSETRCPTRVLEFTPGVLAPGRMTEELIRELESKPVQYLLWSNRKFPEFGAPVFGEDYDQLFGNYLRTHYRPLRPLTPSDTKGWSAVIWERIPAGESQ